MLPVEVFWLFCRVLPSSKIIFSDLETLKLRLFLGSGLLDERPSACQSLSVIMVYGRSNLHLIDFWVKSSTLLSVICAKGSASTYLVNSSMVTTINFFWPDAGGKGSSMSIFHCAKDHGATTDDSWLANWCFMLAYFWHGPHLQTSSAVFFFMVGQ